MTVRCSSLADEMRIQTSGAQPAFMKSKCPSWRGKAPVRTCRQARGLGVHRSEAERLDGRSGRIRRRVWPGRAIRSGLTKGKFCTSAGDRVGFEGSMGEAMNLANVLVHPTDAEANFASEMLKSDMCMMAGSWTFRFRVPFATRSWRKGWLKNTSGFPIQAGLRFGFGVTRICSTRYG